MLRFFGRFTSSMVRRWIWHILLWDCAQVDNRIGDAVSSAEGHHDSRLDSIESVAITTPAHTMIHSDIPAAITE
jgi:hypothetical protein